jgi:hypothetical protein
MVIARAREIFGADAETTQLEAVRAPAGSPLGAGEHEPSVEPASSSPVLQLIEQTRAERKAHHERVAGLFPAPEATEWNVREIAYDRTRRARAGT